jgi:hypothetical protein
MQMNRLVRTPKSIDIINHYCSFGCCIGTLKDYVSGIIDNPQVFDESGNKIENFHLETPIGIGWIVQYDNHESVFTGQSSNLFEAYGFPEFKNYTNFSRISKQISVVCSSEERQPHIFTYDQITIESSRDGGRTWHTVVDM